MVLPQVLHQQSTASRLSISAVECRVWVERRTPPLHLGPSPQRSNGQPCGCRSALRFALIVVLNEKLLEVMGDDVTQEQAFAHANDVLKNAVGGISDIIHIPGAGEQSTSRTSRP
jgi:hypothetical protein